MELLANYSSIPFFILATTSVVCAIAMIFNPNLIRAGFTLIGSFVAIAGLYFLLYANFVAVSQVLIYAVGIVLVIVFAVMLCSLKETVDDVTNDEDISQVKEIGSRRIVALIVCTLVFALLSYVVNSQDWAAIANISGAEAHMDMIPAISRNYTFQIGNSMLSYFVLPFELISVLLLVVLVGSIILSKKHIDSAEIEVKANQEAKKN